MVTIRIYLTIYDFLFRYDKLAFLDHDIVMSFMFRVSFNFRPKIKVGKVKKGQIRAVTKIDRK